MTPKERFEKVCSVFEGARELPEGDARSVFLRDACQDDDELRVEVEAMLAAHDSSADPDAIESLPDAADLLGDLWAETNEPDVIPTRVGKYKIRRLLGSGSVGTVYEAEEKNPRRRVALKFLSNEFASATVHDRFRQEAEALAAVQHPGICQIYEMGTAQTSRGPTAYLALELIDGAPLLDHAERKQLSLEERLGLIAELCDIVTHAHQRGVIHRDLKPHNILVTDEGQPKILDFGLARFTDDRTRAGFTHTGLVVGTLAYMSPEQASGLPDSVDTRTDVYALGALAYELATGQLPHAVDGKPVAEALSLITRSDARPASSVNSKCPTDASVVVGMAIARDKQRRYQSAEAFSEDIRRFLSDEPIVARAPTPTYHLKMFVKRNKALVTGLTVAVIALTVGLVLAIKFASEASRHAEAASHAAAVANVHAAVSDLHHHNRISAEQKLEQVPPELRRWEWEYLHSRLDTSIHAEALPIERLYDTAGLTALWADPHWRPILSLLFENGLFMDGSAVPVDLNTGAPFQIGGQTLGGHYETAVGTDPVYVIGYGKGWNEDPERETSYRERDLLVVDRASGEVQKRIYLGNVNPYAGAFDQTRDGDLVAFGLDTTIGVLLLAPATGELRRLRAQRPMGAVAFSPDAKHLAGGSLDMNVWIWDVDTGELTRTLETNGGFVYSLAYSHDGRRIAAGVSDGNIHVWDLETGEKEVLLGHTAAPRALRFSADDRRLVSLGDDAYREWLVTDEQRVLRHHRTKAEGNPYPYVYAARFSPDGQRIVTAGWDGTARVIDATTLELERTLEAGRDVRSLCFPSPSEVLLVGRGVRSTWNFETGDVLRSEDDFTGHRVACSPDGSIVHMLAYYGPSSLRVDPETLEAAPWKDKDERSASFRGDLEFSPDGTRLVVSSRGMPQENGTSLSSAFVYDGAADEMLLELPGHGSNVECVAWHPSGDVIATGSRDRLVRLWDAHTGRLLRTLAGHTAIVYALAFSPDGTRLASGSQDKSIRIWDTATGEARLTLRGHEDYVYDLDWSDDGTTLLSGSGDNTARIWTTMSNAERQKASEMRKRMKPGRAPR